MHRNVSAWLVLIVLLGACSHEEPQPPQEIRNLVLIMVDTLRADHLSCYGYEGARTEHIDGLARAGVLFEKVVSAAPWTCPSMASIFTSLYPEAHGMVLHPIRNADKFRALAPGLTTLTEIFKKNGFGTHALSEQAWVSEAFGFAQGFDTFRLLDDEKRILTDEGLKRLKSLPRDKPFFLYLHFLDPHTPYTPPEEFVVPHPGSARYDLSKLDWDAWWQELWNLDRSRPDVEEFLSYVRSLYDGEILFVDHEIGRLLKALDDLGLSENTAVALISDHGEAFGEHAMLHGSTLFNEELKVPMILKIPWNPDLEGVVVDRPASTLDLMPTLISVFDLPLPRGLQGKVRLPASKEEEEPLLCSENAYNLDLKKIQSDRFSLIMNKRTHESLFCDLVNDPSEREDVKDLFPEAFTRFWNRMAGWIAEQERWEKPDSPKVNLSEEMEERLRGLGYIK